MVKRKSCNDDPKILARSVPLPLQIFLWRQSSPFIRPKLGRLYEASCVSFERVLVEKKLHGLSPSLSDAITSITRWQLIQASLPHLMHCSAALISNRAKLGHADKLGVGETKLLYTLHWVLLESLQECLQEDSTQLDFLRLPGNSEHGLTTIQLFVYLFAPLVYSIKESDLTFRLANGLKLWRALWDHKLPEISCFNAQVKPKRCYRLANRRIWKEPEISSKVEEEEDMEEEKSPEESPKAEEPPTETPPGVVVPLADISEVSRFSSGAITPDPPSVNVEILCEVCNTSVTSNNSCQCGNLKVTGEMAPKTRFNFDPISSSSSEDETKPLKPNRTKERPKSLIERSILPLHEGFDHAELAASLSVPRPPPPSTSPTDLPKRRLPQRINDVFSATYFDVGVMRCLFIPHWAEEGVQWALVYLLNRLRQISDETMAAERVRQRSNSSPIPQITISLFSPAPGPPKKYSVPMSCMGGSEPSKDEGRHRDSYPLVGSPKKIKFERVEPLPLRKISPPKRSILGDQGRGSKTHRKLRRTSSLSKAVGALMPHLIKEEVEEGRSGSGSDEQIVQTGNGASTKPPTLGEMPKSASVGTPKLEPFKFKIDVVQLKTVPALMSPEELTRSPSSPPLYSTGSLDSKRPLVAPMTTSFASRPTALPYQQSFSATATKLPSFVQVSADAAHKPTVVTTQTRPFVATSKVSPIVIPTVKTEKSSTCFTVTKTTTNVQSTSIMTAKADFFAEHTNSTNTKQEKLFERRAMKSEKNLITLHKPVSMEVQERPLLMFDEPIKIEPQPIQVIQKANIIEYKAPLVVNRPLLQRQSPVFEALPQAFDTAQPDDTSVTFEVAKPLTPTVMTNSKSPPTSPEELSPLPEMSPSSVSSGSLLIPLTDDRGDTPPPPSPCSPDRLDRPPHHDSCSNMSTLEIPSFLPRSASDTFVNYHTAEEEEITEAAGSTYYIQEDGQMNYSVIIKALHKIITKETSAKICDTSLHIIETILEFRVVKQSEKPTQAKIPVIKVEGEKVKAPDKDGEGDVASKSLEDMSVHNLVMETLIQVFRALGCHHGCGEGLRGHSGDKLRLMGQQCLNRMFKIDPSQFRRYLRFIISTHPLENILDFLHALLGFCEDPVRIPHRPGMPFYNAGPSTGPNEGIARGGFATNFGSGVAGTGVRGIEGTIVGSIFKALVTRLANSRDELTAPENSSLYSDVRQLLHYIREAHGGVFRRVALSGLIDSSGKGQDDKDKEKMGKVGFSEAKSDLDRNLPNPTGKDGGEGGDVSPGTRLRRHLFKKKFRSQDCTLEEERLAEGAGGKRRFSVFQFAQAVTTWRNRAIRSNLGSEDVPEIPEPTETTPRIKKVHTEPSSVYSGRKKVDDHSFFLKFRKKSKRDPSSAEERDDCETPRSLEDDEEMASDSLDMTTEKERKPVDRNVIAAGMKRLNLLMDCCNPGTVPDAEFLAAALDLNAPVVARAALLLECSHFVYRCNHGDWPEWMKSGRGYQRGRVSSNVISTRTMGSCYRKNASMQRMASKMFYLWAEAIGARLEEIERQEAKDLTTVIGKIKDESVKRRLRQQDDQEDFLDEATVNPSGTACPHALKMVACQLLQEITSFLRETYQSLPKPRKVDRGGFGRAPTRDSEFLELPSSSAPSMSAVQRQASAGSSVTSSPPPPRHSVPSTVVDSPSGTSERKISFALGGDDDSQHSSNTELNNVDQQMNDDKKVTPGRKQSRGGLLRRHPAPSSPAARDQHNHSFRNRHRSRPDSLFGTQAGSQAAPATDSTPHVKFSAESQPTIIGMSHENSAPAVLGRSGSVKSRKISSISVDDDSTGETSSVFSEQVSPQEPEHAPDLASTPDTVGLDDIDLSKNMPWIPIVVEIASKTNFICNHQRCCHPNCFERQKRNCYRLMKAVRYINGEDSILRPREEDMDDKVRRMDGKGKRKESGQGHSALRSFKELRRESTSSTLDRQVSVFRHQAATSTSRTNSAVALTSGTFPMELEWPRKEESPQLKYLKTQAMYLWHSPLSLLSKAAPILTEDLFSDILTLAWELLLDSSQQLAGSAAAMVLICAVKIPETVTKLIASEMHHQEAGQRADAIQRFAVLWRFRHQVWPRMEEKASAIFRVPPPSIDFTVPSPTIGLSNLAVIDPPWMPVKTSDLEEKVSTEEETSKAGMSAWTLLTGMFKRAATDEPDQRSFAAVAVSRTTQRREHIKKTLLREQEKKRAARETFHMTNVPILTQAAYEPSHHVTSDDEDDTPMPVTVSMSARRVSIAPPATMGAAAGLNRGRNLSIRRASLWSGGASTGNTPGDDEGLITERAHHSPPTFGVFFPSCICTTIVHLVALLDDSEVNKEGVAVSEVAEKVLWACLVEEPALICRYILEKITAKNKQEDLILLMKKMVSHYGELPAQTAHCLFNYLLGFVVYHCRAPHEGANEAIANTLIVLWHIIPFVSGISFKDLKQTLKKEQCDPTVLISANVPCAKKLIVHGPNETDIPTQLPISEDMQFEEIHQDCLEFFNIPIHEHCTHFLVDKKTNQMLDVKSYVRDFYAYKRSQCPELILRKMDQMEGLEKLQQQAFTLKIAELGRVYFALSTLQSTPPALMSSHITFLHDELIRLPSFPRKSLDAEFLLYTIPKQGRELFGLDVIHKYMWVKFTAAIFLNMSSDFAWTGDIQLFLNVLNGCLLLHCEDISLLRLCLASFINISRHFKQNFATKGFQYVMPTILRVYNYHYTNPLVSRAIEYVCRQFYVLHMKPFVLQLFGSAAPLLQGEEEINPQKISPQCLFRLLLSMEKDSQDSLDILELVTGDKPMKTLDFCYSNDHLATFSIGEAIRLCAIVVAYAPESIRSAQMLSVLADLVPLYLEHVKEQTKKRDNPSAAKSETSVINSMGVCIKSLIIGAETLARSTSGPSRKIENVNATTSFKSSNNSQQSSVHKASRKSAMNAAGADLGEEDMREDFKFRYNDYRVRRRYEDDSEDAEPMNEFCRPRDMLLNIAAGYYCHSLSRLKELRPHNDSRQHSSSSSLELLDQRCHLRLAEVAHTLLKVAPHDPITMGCKGLQMYITQMIPQTDWTSQDLRPALILILKRLDKLFNKIHKKPTLMRHMDWESAANFLKGIYVTLTRQSIISHLPHLKSLLNICLALLLCDGSAPGGGDGLSLLTMSSPTGGMRFTPPPVFCSAVVRVVAMQMHCMKHQYWMKPKDLYTLEQVFGGTPVFNSAERTETILLYLVIPLCLRVGCGRKDSPKIRPSDISFALTMILYALLPPKRQPTTEPGRSSGMPPKQQHHFSSLTDLPSHTSVSNCRDSNSVIPDSLYEAGFLGLKMMMVCFENQLSREWFRIASAVRELGSRMLGGIALWGFMDFVITVRTPLYVMLKPFIAFKMMRMICETDHEVMMQRYVGQKLRVTHSPQTKCKSETMLELVNELRHLRDNMFVPRDRVKFTDELAVMTGQRAQVFEEMEITSPFQQRGSIISRLTRKATITSRRSSSRQSSSRRNSTRRRGSVRSSDSTDHNANNSDQQRSLSRSNSGHGRRSIRHGDPSCIAEADDEREEEEEMGSPLRPFQRRHNTKRISRSTSSRRHVRPEAEVHAAPEESVIHIDPLIEKSDDDIDDGTNEQSRLLQQPASPRDHHSFSAPMAPTDTEDDLEGIQETVRLLDMAKMVDPTIMDRRGSTGVHDTCV